MTYIKLLIALAGLSFLVACGSSATPANNNTGGDNSGGDNSGGDNSGNGGGQPDPCANGACVNTATWLSNARNLDNTAALPIPIAFRLPSETDSYSFITATTTELNLTDARDKSVVRLGDLVGNDNATSGFALGTIGVTFDTRRYVGILSGTNVGAPLAGNITTAEWAGMFSIQRESGNTKKAITLDVAFAGTTGTIKTKTGGFYYTSTGGSGTPNIVIDGEFGTNGVIYGTTTGTNTNSFVAGAINGTLTGLIGANGAVAVFAGNNDEETYGYAGGFVAALPPPPPPPPPPAPCTTTDTCVDYADWLATFTGNKALPTTPDTTPHKSQFLQTTDTSFTDGANAGIRVTFGSPKADIPAENLTFDNTDTATGGVAFFGGAVYNDSDVRVGIGAFYYAGILDGTNLGAPITETITTAVTWTGAIRAFSAANEGRIAVNGGANFDLDITFDGDEGTIKTKTIFIIPNTGGYAYS
ncbi:MAG: hypothetical protein K8953_09765, partial [Proteobacteria bacterium]|nr:hypothetical protein [Pseudomonadota bacterium]